MHIPLTFQFIINFSHQTSSTLQSIHTNQPQHNFFHNNNSHHSITHPSYFYHLFTQLLFHHYSHTINSISFSSPPQHTSPSFHPQHPSTLSSPSHLLQTTHINHPLYQLFTNLSSISMSQPAPQSAHHHFPSYCKLCFLAPGWGVTSSF